MSKPNAKSTKVPFWQMCIQLGMCIVFYAFGFVELTPVFGGVTRFHIAFYLGLFAICGGIAFGIISLVARRKKDAEDVSSASAAPAVPSAVPSVTPSVAPSQP